MHHRAIPPEQYPEEIHLKAGFLVAEPFGTYEDGEYGGFMVDMWNYIELYALADGVRLEVDLTPVNDSYGHWFNHIANDCNTTANPLPKEECDRYDLIVGPYYTNGARYRRGDFSPPWLKSSVSSVKKKGGEFSTLTQAEQAGALVCVPDDSYLAQFIANKFPGAYYLGCSIETGECLRLLKEGECVLFAEDELTLHYYARDDPELEVTRDRINTQYISSPLKENLPFKTLKLLKTWFYLLIQTSDIDNVYFKYFKRGLCPVGTAGKNCELPCHPDTGVADASGVCQCISTKWTGADCSTEVPEELNLLPLTMVYICYSLAGLNYLVVVLCAIWLFYNRHRSSVRVAQPTLLLMLLLGCAISTSSIFALGQEHQDDNGHVPACMAIPWLYSIGFSITFGALFVRIKRIYVLLQSAVELKRVSISSTETILTVGLVLILDGSILTVWTIVDPLHWIRITTSEDVFGEPLESVGLCWSDHWEIFGGIIASLHLLLMGIACYMCYLARAIPERISNLKYVGIAMFGNFQILICLIPILIILGSDPQTSFFVRSLGIWLNDFAVVTLIFGDLYYKVQKRNRRRTFRSSELVIHQDIRTYAQKARSKINVLVVDLNAADVGEPPQANYEGAPSRATATYGSSRQSSQPTIQVSSINSDSSSEDEAEVSKVLGESTELGPEGEKWQEETPDIM